MSDPITKKGMGFKCIPASWIQNTLIDNYLITRYPLEQNSETELQVKNRQPACANWPFFCATIVYRTDAYEKATEFIRDKQKEPLGAVDKQQNNMDEQSNVIENETPTANKRKNTEKNETPNENSLPKKPRISATRAKKTVKKKPAVSPKKQKISPKTSLLLRKRTRTRTLKKPIRPSQFDNIEKLFSERDSPSKTPLSDKESNDDLTIDANDDSECDSSPPSPAKNNLESKIGPKTAPEPSIKVGTILKNLLTSLPKEKKKTAEKPSEINIKQIENIYNTILEVKSKLKTAYEEANLLLKKSFEGIDFNVPELKYISTLITENIQPTDGEKPPLLPTVGSPKEQLLSPKPSRPAEPKLSEIPISSEKPPMSERSPTKMSSTKKTADTKWTLRHQGPGTGLIELMPFSGIYVSQAELSNCQALVSDVKKFARVLLPMIFTTEALRTCTYTGNRPKMKFPESFEVRPGLDENARNTLLAYVMKYGNESGWPMVSPEVIITSLKNKLQIQKYRCNIK
uniref:BEN domain-containing protein n=2 Tax=Heliothis virescens TaxID=7102 RepID=A0A2A4IZV6_HELVI